MDQAWKRVSSRCTLLLLCALLLCLHRIQASTRRENGNSNGAQMIPEDTAPAQSGDEWAERFRCETSANATHMMGGGESFRLPFSNFWSNLFDEKCNKDQQAWRFKYFDELMSPDFSHQVRDASPDERLANIIETIDITNMFDNSLSHFGSGDGAQDLRNELLVAGPQVNESRCARDLEDMVRSFDEFKVRLEQLRSLSADSDAIGGDSTAATRIDEERFIRLARVLDSFGRYESGALDSKTHLMGDYNECLSSQLLGASPTTLGGSENRRLIPMRYCWANMKSDRELHRQLRERTRFAHETSRGLLKAAVCLPRSCHSKSLHAPKLKQLVQKFTDSQLRLPSSIYQWPTYELESVFCLVDPDSQYGRLPLSGKLLVTFIACWLLFCVAMTLANKRSQQQQQQLSEAKNSKSLMARLAGYLDLARSWRDFTSDKSQDDAARRSGLPVDLDVLNPVKFGAAILCISFHSMFLIASTSTSQVRIAAQVDGSSFLLGSTMTGVVVDTFFVLSGLLGAYISLIKLDRYAKRRAQQVGMITRESRVKSAAAVLGQWLALAANRYLRISPLYALMFWFRRDVLTYLGWGPLWDHGLNKETMNGACLREPWYMPLTPLAAFVWPTKQCFMPAWSIALDILFGALVPPVILLMRKHPRLAINGVFALIACSLLALIEALTTARPAGVRWELLDARISGFSTLFTSFNYLYAWPVYRASGFLVGTVAGYCLHVYAKRATSADSDRGQDYNNAREPKRLAEDGGGWPTWVTGPATWAAVIYVVMHGIVSIYTYKIVLAIEPYHRLMTLYINTVDRFVWSLANAILFLRMTTDWRLTPVMRWFSRQLWRTLAKLAYPIVFVHWLFMVTYLGSQSVQPTFAFWNIFATFSTLIMTTLPASLLVHVLFESPLDKLIKGEILALF